MKKQTKGKDEHGVFHPGKGKPSGVNKQEGLGLQATEPEKMDQYIELTEKYTIGEDELDPAVPVRHPNRNTSKGQNTFKAKENTPASDKTVQMDVEDGAAALVAEELPGVLTKDRFKELALYKADCCISIYLGTHASGVQVNEQHDLINFKNQLQQVQQKLVAKGMAQENIEQLLRPGLELVQNTEFWKTLSPGFAVFIADGFFKYIKMPSAPAQEELVIESSFFVTPLVQVMVCKEYFYLLVLSKKGVKLFNADAWGMQIVPVELPQSVDEVKRLSGLDATTFRSGETGSRAPAATQEGSYHGTGGGNPDGKDNLLVYFEAVDDILWSEVFNKENAPLLLAAVEYEIPIYRSACDYHNVWPEALTGNREYQETNSLYQDAKAVMQPYFDQPLEKALANYGNQSATALTSSVVAVIVPASYYAQVSHLFVCKGAHVWGNFDEMDNKLELHNGPDEGGENLLDNAVVNTLVNGGEVFLLDKEQMPADSSMAAIFRYA